MTDQKPAYVRTGTPIGAGAVITYVAKRVFDLDLSADDVLLILPVVMYAYYVLGRVLENLNPKLGYILGIAKQPAYAAESAPAPNKDEDVVAVVVPAEGVEQPVQTDNRPRLEDGEQLPEDIALGETDFTGDMR